MKKERFTERPEETVIKGEDKYTFITEDRSHPGPSPYFWSCVLVRKNNKYGGWGGTKEEAMQSARSVACGDPSDDYIPKIRRMNY